MFAWIMHWLFYSKTMQCYFVKYFESAAQTMQPFEFNLKYENALPKHIITVQWLKLTLSA